MCCDATCAAPMSKLEHYAKREVLLQQLNVPTEANLEAEVALPRLTLALALSSGAPHSALVAPRAHRTRVRPETRARRRPEARDRRPAREPLVER